MNIPVQSRMNTCFELTDLDVHVRRYFEEEGVTVSARVRDSITRWR